MKFAVVQRYTSIEGVTWIRWHIRDLREDAFEIGTRSERSLATQIFNTLQERGELLRCGGCDEPFDRSAAAKSLSLL